MKHSVCSTPRAACPNLSLKNTLRLFNMSARPSLHSRLLCYSVLARIAIEAEVPKPPNTTRKSTIMNGHLRQMPQLGKNHERRRLMLPGTVFVPKYVLGLILTLECDLSGCLDDDSMETKCSPRNRTIGLFRLMRRLPPNQLLIGCFHSLSVETCYSWLMLVMYSPTN